MVTPNEIEVELTGVHLCCQGCVNAADAALRRSDLESIVTLSHMEGMPDIFELQGLGRWSASE